MAVNKKYLIKILQPNGTTFVSTIKRKEIKREITFSSKINSGLGQCTLDLALPFQDYGEGTVIDYNNIVEIYIVDTDNPLGRLVYTGYISQYKPYFSGNDEGVEVTLLGLATILRNEAFQDADFSVSYAAADPSQMFKDIIDNYQTVTGDSSIWYGTNIDMTGESVSYTFVNMFWSDSLKKAFEFCPAGWWWRIEANGEVVLKDKPATPTHNFVNKKHIESGYSQKNSESVINSCRVIYNAGGSYSEYEDIPAGDPKKLSIITDVNISNAASALTRATQEVNSRRSPKAKISLNINSAYDLETIKVGDTCRVLNMQQDEQLFAPNMHIYSVRYIPDGVGLELEDFIDQFGTIVNTPPSKAKTI